MAEYTPTTEEIIRAYSIPTYHVVERLEGESFSEYLARASIEGHVSQVESEAAARRWLAAHDAEVRAGVVAEEPEWGVWDQRDRVFRHVHPPTEENARRESALGGSDFEATRALPWVPVKQEGAMPDA